jgi:hypothetical protein
MHQRDGTVVFRVGDFMFTDMQLVELMVKKRPNPQGVSWRRESTRLRAKSRYTESSSDCATLPLESDQHCLSLDLLSVAPDNRRKK